MARKKEGGITESIVSTIKEVVSSAILEHLKSALKDLILKAQEAAYRTEEKIMESLFASLMLLSGIIFVALSIALMISKYLNVGNEAGYLIIGLVLAVASLILQNNIKKTRYSKM